jgi:hypothetical protein
MFWREGGKGTKGAKKMKKEGGGEDTKEVINR